MNPVARWQLLSPDPDATAEFWTRAFGWSVSRANALGYREVDTGGMPGGIWPAPPGAPAMVQLFIEVEDVGAAVATAEARGATVLVPRSVLPDGDVMAVLRDPQGLPFGLFTAAKDASPAAVQP
jgi:predicted enzyme related to lactoylglutathione lyase